MDIATGIKIATLTKDIFLWATKEDPEPELDEDLLVLFRAFKTSYDQKDAATLGRSFSSKYSGSMWGYQSKAKLIGFFREVFEGLPRLLKPRLKVTILKSRVDAKGVAKVTVDFESKITVAGFAISGFDLGRVVVTAEEDPASGLYLITRLDDAK